MEVDHPFRLLARDYSDTQITTDTHFASMVMTSHFRSRKENTKQKVYSTERGMHTFTKIRSEII